MIILSTIFVLTLDFNLWLKEHSIPNITSNEKKMIDDEFPLQAQWEKWILLEQKHFYSKLKKKWSCMTPECTTILNLINPKWADLTIEMVMSNLSIFKNDLLKTVTHKECFPKVYPIFKMLTRS